MAGFWRKRKQQVQDASTYVKATEAVSKPAAFMLSMVAFVLIFSVVFGSILGGQWLWHKLRDDKGTSVVQEDNTNKPDSNEATKEDKPAPVNTNNAPDTAKQTAPSTPTTIVGSASSTTTPNVIPRTGPDPDLP